MPLPAVDVPEARRVGAIGEVVELQLFAPFFELFGRAARLAHAGEIALHVGEKYRYAQAAEAFGQPLQRHGLAGAGGAGDQPMPVRHARVQVNRLARACEVNAAALGCVGGAIGGWLGARRQRRLLGTRTGQYTDLACGCNLPRRRDD